MCDLSSMPLSFFFNDTATTEIYTLSLHDALPISLLNMGRAKRSIWVPGLASVTSVSAYPAMDVRGVLSSWDTFATKRSEEHTSELQSQSNLVCRLLLEKKKSALAERTLHPALPPD